MPPNSFFFGLAFWFSCHAFCLWSGRSEVQTLCRSNRTHCCLRLATAATFHRKELCCSGAMTRRRVPQTRPTLRRITASIMKVLILICLVYSKFASNVFNAYELLSNRNVSKKDFLVVFKFFVFVSVIINEIGCYFLINLISKHVI